MKKIIEKLDDFGRGITYVNNKITFIPKCIKGDEVDFIITEEKKKYFLGKLNKIIKKDSEHIDSKCPFYQDCGGCCLQNLEYEKTIEFKKHKIENLLKRNKINFNNITITKNPSPYNYRNKITLKIKDGNIGFYEEGSHKIVSINHCLLAKTEINKVIELLPFLNIINGEITIRCNYKNEILLIIKTKEEVKIPKVLIELINIVGIILNDKVVYKKSSFIDKINDIYYEVSFDSFFQVNPFVTSLLLNKIKANLENSSMVYDLYCGVGTISLAIASKCKKVIGIEVVKNAVINATKNKTLNNISNAEFILKDLSSGVKEDFIPDTVIVDPPRSGIDKKTILWLKNIKPQKIIYVSCDPNTLVRDLKILDEYNIKSLDLFDMFSYTYHVESVTLLQRKD